MSIPLSAVIITYNAADHLDICLSSLPPVEEILVVDSGSTDQTRAVSEKHGARFVHQDWLGYGAQKQVAVDMAVNDWVLCIDADEWLSDELKASVVQIMQKPAHTAYAFPRCNRFMGRWLRHGEGYPDIGLRLFDRRHARWSDDPIHEKVVADGHVGRLQGDLMHDSASSLEDYLAKQNRYTTLQAGQLYRQGKRAGTARLVLNPMFRFLKFYIFRLGFLDGLPGLVHISIGCFNTFMKYAKLIDLQRDEG